MILIYLFRVFGLSMRGDFFDNFEFLELFEVELTGRSSSFYMSIE